MGVQGPVWCWGRLCPTPAGARFAGNRGRKPRGSKIDGLVRAHRGEIVVRTVDVTEGDTRSDVTTAFTKHGVRRSGEQPAVLFDRRVDIPEVMGCEDP